MRISDIPNETILDHCGVSEDPAGLIPIYKDAAIAEICAYTGLSTEELDEYGDITYAFLALVCEMFNTRQMTVEIDRLNPMATQILDSHRRNLL